MPKQSHIVTKASEFISRLFSERLPEYLVYHTYEHSAMVAETARKIGKGMQLGEEGLEVVMLAAFFHDTGYTEIYRGHEEVSIRIATEFLEQEEYPEQKIKLITGCIRATKIPQQPKNLLEEIVADADLSGLGRKSFFKTSEMLHIEWEKALGMNYTDEEWTQQNLELLAGHRFFTNFAKQIYSEQLAENIRITYKKLRKLASSARALAIAESDEYTDGEAKGIFSVGNTIPEESIAPVTLNSNSADKPEMMIFTSAVILGIGILILVILRLNGVSDRILEIPLMVLFVVSILTIVFSLLSMRRASSNFIAGEDQNKKYRYLHLSYNFFLFGVPLSIAAFVVLFLLRT